jgi:hypothetical protein
MPDNEFEDIQSQILELNHELDRLKRDPDPLARVGIQQALALAHIARELNKFNFRKKFGQEAE